MGALKEAVAKNYIDQAQQEQIKTTKETNMIEEIEKIFEKYQKQRNNIVKYCTKWLEENQTYIENKKHNVLWMNQKGAGWSKVNLI